MKKVLKNGVTVLTEKIDNVRSVSLGIWIVGGSVCDNISGMAHYMEHMAFKGTNTRSADELAQEFDEMGGDINAFTAKEVTCYYGRMLDTHLNKGLTLLADMVLNPAYLNEETENERRVILEEIAMYEDSPDDLSIGRLTENVWRHSPLGKEILGTEQTVNSINPENLRESLKRCYSGSNIYIAACGHLDEESFIERCEELFSNAPIGEKAKIAKNTQYEKSIILTEKSIEQNHICIGFKGIDMYDSRKYHQTIFTSVLGGGMSSRLFQKIREKEGLAYSVSAQFSSYSDAGLYSIYTALNPKSQDKCLSIIRKELDDIKKNGITEKELNRAKEQMKSAVIIDLESTSSQMKFLARKEIFKTAGNTIDDIIELINSVTLSDIHNFANGILDYKNISISVVGTPDTEQFYKGYFE